MCGFPPSNGDTFTILSNDGTDAVVGSFSGVVQGATVDVAGKTFTISYRGGDGNDVVVRVPNHDPTVQATDPFVAASQGSTAANSGSFNDADLNDTVTIVASIGTITQGSGNTGVWNWSFNTSDGPADSQTVAITTTDNHGGGHDGIR